MNDKKVKYFREKVGGMDALRDKINKYQYRVIVSTKYKQSIQCRLNPEHPRSIYQELKQRSKNE